MSVTSRKATSGSGGTEPGPKRRRLLDAGGPIEDDETARQKMRRAAVYEIMPDGTPGGVVGFDPDNVRDVKRYLPDTITPMGYFARKGDLPMMRWLYDNGADTRDEDAPTNFPMYRAAYHGHLEPCKWLFDHGAARDVKRRTYPHSVSPLYHTFARTNQQDFSRWLILNGALCKDDDSGDLDVKAMRKDLLVKRIWLAKQRKALLEWATDLHRARTSFLLFLSGALLTPQHAYRTRRSSSTVKVLSGKSGVLELIGDYTGIVCGREAKIIRKLTELLPDLNRE